MYTCKGKVTFLGEEEVINEEMSKRIFGVETSDSDFQQNLGFELFNEKMGMIDHLNPGEEITVHFYIRGVRSDKGGKTFFYTSLRATKIIKARKTKEKQENDMLS